MIVHDLLVPERVNGVKLGGAQSGKDAKNKADKGADACRQQNGVQRYYRLQVL